MKTRHCVLCLVAILGLAPLGCRSSMPATSHSPLPTRPSVATLGEPEPSEAAPPSASPPLAQRRRYSQETVGQRRASPVHFAQVETAEGRVAGTLLDRASLPVSQYMDLHSNRPQRPRLSWPRVRRAEAFFVEFDPPMEEWPTVAEAQPMLEQHATLTACGPDGIPFSRGDARRRVWHEGVETIRTPAGAFTDCLRVRSETELTFGRWASIRVQETAWLHAQAGVVRRTERIHGHAIIIFRFDSTHRYELEIYDGALTSGRLVNSPPDPAVDSSGVLTHRRWARLAIHLERTGARPRVAGLAVDWAR